MDDLSHLTDGQLVARAAVGDGDSYGELVFRYRRAAYGVALSVTRRHEDAEDAAQEAFLVALQRIEECRNPERFGAWFMTIVRNRARNVVRRESLRKGEALPFTAVAPGDGPDRHAERSQLKERLSGALGQLSELQREVVLLHDLEGWKHREIAEKLEMPPGTVRSHLHYARKRLRECLGNTGGSEIGERQG